MRVEAAVRSRERICKMRMHNAIADSRRAESREPVVIPPLYVRRLADDWQSPRAWLSAPIKQPCSAAFRMAQPNRAFVRAECPGRLQPTRHAPAVTGLGGRETGARWERPIGFSTSRCCSSAAAARLRSRTRINHHLLRRHAVADVGCSRNLAQPRVRRAAAHLGAA